MADKLKKYNEKRNFKQTKEPQGKIKKNNKELRFVVHHHMASREHYDFRLEWQGTLKSWAIPKGPSLNPNDKRLAVEVEDHPLDYRNFEGVIPEGQYGGGTVLIWDEGTWELFDEEFDDAIKFELKGQRLKGIWKLFRMKENNWLLVKELDDYSKNDAGINEFITSVRTNRTMKEIEADK